MIWLGLLPLLLLIGGIKTERVLLEGKELVYEYNTTIASGIPEGGSQYSIFTLGGKLTAWVQADKIIVFKLYDIEVGERNDQFPDLNLRTLRIHTGRHPFFEKYLKLPFGAKFHNGKVLNTYFNNTDEIWSKDLKKGIIDLFQQSRDKDTTDKHPNEVPGRGPRREAYFWRSKESSVIGKCDVQNTKQTLPYPGNPEAQVFNITRQLNTENANDTAKFILTDHPPIRATECDGRKSFPITHNVITKLGVVIQDNKHVIHDVYREGVVKVSIMGPRGDSVYSIYNQWLVLRRMTSAQSQPPRLPKEREEGMISNLEAQMKAAYSPDENIPHPRILANLTANARRLLNEIADATITGRDHRKINLILALQILIQKVFSNLPSVSLEDVVGETLNPSSERDRIKMKAALDILGRTGTREAMLVAISLIERKKVTDNERIISLLENIPAHALFPNLEIASRIILMCEKIKMPHVPIDIEKACFFSLAEMVGRSCATYNSSYPNRPTRDESQCPASKEKAILLRYLKFLEEHRDFHNEEMEAAAVASLGLMNLRSNVIILQSIALEYQKESQIIRRTAIYALAQLSKMFPEDVRPIMFSILHNSVEKPENRIAAVTALIASRPPQQTFDELAAYTWIVKDQQVGSFIITSLQALSNVTTTGLKEIGNFARHALKVANIQVKDSVFMGYESIVAKLIAYLDVGFASRLEFLGEDGSFIPTGWNWKWQSYAAGYLNEILRFSGTVVELRDVFDKIWGPAYIYSRDSIKDIVKKLNQDIPDQGLDFINKKLGIIPRTKTEESALLMTMRRLYFKVNQYYVNASQLPKLLDEKLLQNDSININGSFDLRRYMMPLDIKYVIPSAAGHHLHLDIKLPMMAAVRGNYSVKSSGWNDCDWELNTKFNVEPVLSGKLHVKFGPVVPCGQSHECEESKNRVPLGPTWGVHLSGGFETILMVKYAGSGESTANLDHRNKRIKVSFTPKDSTPKQVNELAYYKSKPFTSIYPRSSLLPLSIYFSKPMRIRDKPYKVDYPIPLTNETEVIIKGKHEDQWLDQADIITAIKKRGVGGIINFPLLTERLRMREFTAMIHRRSFITNYTANLFWEYTPAESDPQPQPKSSRQAIWKALSGWFYVPRECRDLHYTAKMFMKPRGGYGLHDRSSGSSEERGQWGHGKMDMFSGKEGRSWERSSEESFGGRGGQSGQGSGGSGSDEQPAGRSSGERRDWIFDFGSKEFGKGLNHRTVPISKGTAILHLRGSLEVRGRSRITYSFNSTMRSEKENLTKTLEAFYVKRKGREELFTSTVRGSYKSFYPLCNFKNGPFAGRGQGDDPRLSGDVEIKWSSSEQPKINTVKAWSVARKSGLQRKRESLPVTDKTLPWYYTACDREIRRGFLNHGACQRVMDHRNELHHVDFDVDYSQANISREMNKTITIGWHWLNSVLFNYISDDLNNTVPRGHAKMVMKFNDTMPVVNFYVKTAEEKTKFQDVYYGQVLPGLQPPSTGKSIIRRALEYATDYQFPTACLSSGRYLTTFNNVTEDLNGTGNCPYLLTKDCSTGNSFYVLLKNNDKIRTDNKSVVIGVREHAIVINPSQTHRDIIIDGLPDSMPDKNVDFIRDPQSRDNLIAIVVKTIPIYNVLLPYLGIRVKFDGNNIKVQASDFWRGKLCGLCGEFRGRRRYHRIGPDQCAYPSDETLVSKYVLHYEGSCSAPLKPSPKLCDLNSHLPALPAPRVLCEIERHYILRGVMSGAACFTTEVYRKCTQLCVPSGVEVKDVDAKCFQLSDERIPSLEREIEEGPVPFLREQTPNFQARLAIPLHCVPLPY